MPMQLAIGTLLQMLLGTRNIMAGWQIRDDLLSGPTTIEKSRSGITETPSQIWDEATVRALSSEIVGLLEVKLVVCSTCSS